MLANIFVIIKPIVISVKFQPNCKGCSRRDSLGGAIYSSAFAINQNGQIFLCPQSLIKQMKPDRKLEYFESDITAEFNSEQRFYFPHNNQNKIGASEIDFELLLCMKYFMA
jgi:hypothetical protein